MFVSLARKIFGKQHKLQVIFIDETGQAFKKNVRYGNNTFDVRIAGEKHTYLVNQKKITYWGKEHKPTSVYHTNNPEPIGLSHMRNEELDSIGFKKILDSKAIAELFASEGMKTLLILMILIGINLALSAVIILIDLKVIKVGAAAAP